ncbi:MAG: phosphoenolpyruvate synthase [Pseudohongiellaceae bacterium]
MSKDQLRILWLDELNRSDVARVGGKNASLGEMLKNMQAEGIPVPLGFATTASAYWEYVDANGLRQTIADTMGELGNGSLQLAEAGDLLRKAFLKGSWPASMAVQITAAYKKLSKLSGHEEVSVAVRSSATAEDLPDASFAGQQESYLNICGEQNLLDACQRCYASLFTNRAIAYRQAKGFDHSSIALSIGIQIMVRSDKASSGVMFSIDTETGFDQVVVINSAWGLGENVVQGLIDPDEYQVFKPLLTESSYSPIIDKKLGSKQKKLIYGTTMEASTVNVEVPLADRESFALDDQEVLTLARWACSIEQHYKCPMDIEWAKDGESGSLFIVQARPETVQSKKLGSVLDSYKLLGAGKKILSGLAIGQSIVAGTVCVISNVSEITDFIDGSILVTENTNPDWVPIMKRAAAIITNHGGRTSHAAIVSRELGVPALIGTGNATELLSELSEITVSCAEGDMGSVYAGRLEFSREEIDFSDLPQTQTKIMVNLANPGSAMRWWKLPADGVGLARMEFIISDHVKIHPMALACFNSIKDEAVRKEIEDLTKSYTDKTEYFIDRLASGLARIAAVFHPHPCIIRLSDFKTNEYANLIGGLQFEEKEENPMLGFRGASRYYSPNYQDGFALECKAIVRLREQLGFKNTIVMIPFCRTVLEAEKVIQTLASHGLERGKDGLQLYMMCEVPSNVILAKQFAKHFDGFSIGSNDLTQLTLGVDRDSAMLASLFDETNEAVKWMIQKAIKEAHGGNVKIGLCGQAPSDHPDFARFLVQQGIDSISVTPDSFSAVTTQVAEAERLLAEGGGTT